MTASSLSRTIRGKSFPRNAVALGVALAMASSAHANPTGLSVVAGQATAQSIGNLLQVTNTPGAILNWQQFNIDVGQTTQFIQQNSGSQVFNRVTGGDVSQLLGTLQSNGQVFLINPAGVFFGQGAVIDTAGFLASTLGASDLDLLNGHLKFNDVNGHAGGIVNQGKLTTHSGGSIVLLAPNVENSGIIHADGEVLLAAGHSVTIVDMKHPTIGLTVAVKEGEQAVNLGQIVGRNISVFSHLLKNTGVVEATGAQVGEGGVIRFIAKGDALVGGKLLAESAIGKGGEIDITGERVAVLSGATVSANGATGGGTVHVGGGWQGRDESLANSRQTVVQANTVVSANATESGNGGEVVVWADGFTTVNSEVQAKGGALSGNGGRVETSGRQSLAVTVAANTSAPNGEAGQWLLDPTNLTIVDTIPEGGFDLSTVTGPLFYSTDGVEGNPPPTESFLLNTTVVAGLENNGFVDISTSGGAPGEGNLTVNAPILVSQNLSSAVDPVPSLSLDAKGSININAAIGLQPGQTGFTSFNLRLSYDIAKPVYVNAPIYLGSLGSLEIAPYDIGTALPVNVVGQLPSNGVNLLSGMNSGNMDQPLKLNRIALVNGIGFDPQLGMTVLTSTNSPVTLNVLGANLAVDNLEFFKSAESPEARIRVGAHNLATVGLVQGNLQYNSLLTNSLTIDAGASVSTYNRLIDPMVGNIQSPFSNIGLLRNSGAVQFNGGTHFLSRVEAIAGDINFGGLTPDFSVGPGFYDIGLMDVAATGTVNIANTNLYYGSATVDGSINLLGDLSGFGTFVSGDETNLNGVFSMGQAFNNSNFKVLRMASGSQLIIGANSRVSLGSSFNSPMGQLPLSLSVEESLLASSTGGLFLAEQGALITLNGAPMPMIDVPVIRNPPTVTTPVAAAVFQPIGPSGAVLDLTGLDGRLDTPVSIQSNGFLNSIQSGSENFGMVGEATVVTPINQVLIDKATIQVDAGADGKALRIGGVQFMGESQFPQSESFSLSDLDFRATLIVNSGRVRLDGINLSTTAGNLSVNGPDSLLGFSGAFTSADLYNVARSNGGRIAMEGFWDNSAVTALNAATSAPLSKGNLIVGKDLVISGGLLTSAGTGNTLNIAPEAILELEGTEVTTTINMAQASVLLLRAIEEGSNTPVLLNGAKINMGGDAALIVEADPLGVANLEGTATISSGSQGNLILAGRRLFSIEDAAFTPDDMTLNVGSGIQLEVTGNAPSLPEGLSFYYSQTGISQPPARPVFTIGQLTPEAVGVFEYQRSEFFDPEVGFVATGNTTLRTEFTTPSFVVDGQPDVFNPTPDCSISNLCVKFDVTQAVVFAGSVMSRVQGPTTSLLDSGVSLAPGADLTALRFALQTPTSIQFMQGLNTIAAGDLANGIMLVNGPGSTLQLGMNAANQTLSNNIENNGALDFQGSYTLVGQLTGSGLLNNSGTLVLANTSGSILQNSISNSGVLTNTGSYTLANSISSTGSFNNLGSLTLAAGAYSFTGGYTQNAGNTQLQPGTVLNGNMSINGGALRGFGTINGNLQVNGGLLVPGASPGLMTVNGDLTLAAGSVLDIEIQGNGGVPGTDFDCIVVQGTANLDGQLNLLDLSSGTLGAGNEYAFLKAGTINGSFATVSMSNTGLAYSFSNPELVTQASLSQLLTRTVSSASPGVVGTGSTGGGDVSVINQNLDQAFVPPPANPTTDGTDSGSGSTTTTQQEPDQETVDTANQATAGTTVSQQSNDIELTATRSDSKRPAAVCK